MQNCYTELLHEMRGITDAQPVANFRERSNDPQFKRHRSVLAGFAVIRREVNVING